MRFCSACGARFSQDAAFCPFDGRPTQDLPEEQPPGDPLLGRVLDGRYQVEERLGEGGMGTVYRATHVTLGKRIALKVLRPELAEDASTVKRFMQEAQAASSIGHPNIVDVSDVGSLPDQTVYFAMEYLEGMALGERISRAGALSVDEAVRVGSEVGSALASAHARGIVHRDLKPDNIYLVGREDGGPPLVKVLDFGVAKVGGAATKLTKTGMVFGTPHYMSPEQAAGQGVDGRTDIYALGVILYEMLTGRVPFEADTFMGILSKHMFEPPPALPDKSGDRDLGALSDVIMRALAKKPEQRQASMEVLVSELQQAGAGKPVRPAGSAASPAAGASPEAGAEPSAKPSKRRGTTLSGTLSAIQLPVRRGPRIAAAVVGLTALLGGGAALALAMMGGDGEGAPEDSSPSGTASTSVAGSDAGASGAPGPDSGHSDAGSVPEGRDPDLVQLRSEPEGAEVLREGAVVANTPADLPRPDGPKGRTYELRLSGYEREQVVLREDSPDTLRVSLQRKEASHAARKRPSSERRARRRAERRRRRSAREQTGAGSDRAGAESADDSNKRSGFDTQSSSEVIDPWAQ